MCIGVNLIYTTHIMLFTHNKVKRWQGYTEELYKNDLHDPYNNDGIITLLESDVMEWDVKWAL